MSVSEVELLLQKHVSHRDESFEVWLSGRPRGGGGGAFGAFVPKVSRNLRVQFVLRDSFC